MLAVAAATFLATLIRSTFGFGEALVAVPLLALIIPVEEAVPLATLLSVLVAAILLALTTLNFRVFGRSQEL